MVPTPSGSKSRRLDGDRFICTPARSVRPAERLRFSDDTRPETDVFDQRIPPP